MKRNARYEKNAFICENCNQRATLLSLEDQTVVEVFFSNNPHVYALEQILFLTDDVVFY